MVSLLLKKAKALLAASVWKSQLRKSTCAFNCSTIAGCPRGRFGADCKQDCHCKRPDLCNRFSGACTMGCAAGWKGESCQIRENAKNMLLCPSPVVGYSRGRK